MQSIERAFDRPEMLAEAGGALVPSELAAASGLPLPTVHRLIRTLVNRGYVRQEPCRRYTLGSRLIWLGETSSRMLGASLRPFLAQLVRETGKTANLAMLDGDEVVYLAQVPSPHSMRMFTEPGCRVRVHCTAVGKAMLAQLPPEQARALLERSDMPASTPTTITDPDLLLAHLEVIRKQGYAVDEAEQEIGVRCFAVAVPGAPVTRPSPTSGPQARMTDEAAAHAVLPPSSTPPWSCPKPWPPTARPSVSPGVERGEARYWTVTFIAAGSRSLDRQEIGPGQRCGVPFPGDCLACLPAGPAVIGRRRCALQPSRQMRT